MNASSLYNDQINQLQSNWLGLPDKPEKSPKSTLLLLWKFVCNSFDLSLDKLPDLSLDQQVLLKSLVTKRINGIPLSYLIGFQYFMGMKLLCSPEAIIPRKETEILGALVLDTARKIIETKGDLFHLDLCTGSGNIALLVATKIQNSIVIASDLSEDAVRLALRNKDILGLDRRVSIVQGDLFAPFENETYFNQFDIISCNPPYISSGQVDKFPTEIHNYEPRLAFDGGPFGIRILTRLVRESPRFLKPGGWLCFEVGLGQGNALQNMLKKSGRFVDIEPFYDNSDEIRALKARFKP